MARGILVLLLVVVLAVAVSSYGRYHRRYGVAHYGWRTSHHSWRTSHSWSHHSWSHRYHFGFKIHHHRFSYGGHGYKLRCGKLRFLKLWRRYYGRYGSRRKCIYKLNKLHIIRRGGHIKHGRYGHLINYNVYLKKYHGFKLRHHRFVYRGLAYRLRCGQSKFYSLWRHYYLRYHSVSKIFTRLLRKKLFVIYHTGGHHVNYRSYYNAHHGFTLSGKRFFYNGNAYVLRCGFNQFYRLWYRYYTRYHDITKIFNVLYHRHLFIRHNINYLSYYNAHHGWSLTGKRFLYNGNGYILKVGRSKFYRLWYRYYTQYHNIAKIFRILYHRHLFVRHRINYSSYYNSHHGFSLSGKRFLYHGHPYVLRVGRHKFYRLWYKYYTQYHSIDRVFKVFYQRHYFVRQHINYIRYYRSHHGFSLTGNNFLYNGHAYILRVKRPMLYKLWYRFYTRYHRVSKIFRVLYHRHLFARLNYMSYYNSHHGFTITGKHFLYNGQTYVLRVRRQKFYSYWYRYYVRYHRVAKVFRVLYHRHLFVRLNYMTYYNSHHGFTITGKRFFYHGNTYILRTSRSLFYRRWYIYYLRYKSVSRVFRAMYHKKYFYRHRINYLNYYNSHHGFALKGKLFFYNGNTYVLRVGIPKFYKYWYKYYTRYHSISRIFRVFYKRRFFIRRRINYLKYYTTHHGFTLRGKRFLYNGDDYALRVRTRKFYRLWYQYYHRYHSISKVFQVLYRRRFFRKDINYLNYYNSHNGFDLDGTRFEYNGDAYTLNVNRNKFYRYWYRYYKKYHDVDEIFNVLNRQHFIVKYGGKTGINYVDYYNTHDGFELDDNRFVYDGKTYLLKIARPRFYQLWYQYYNQYHDVDQVFNTLYGRRYFVLDNGDVVAGTDFGDLGNYLDQHRVIANHHVSRINTVASSHVSRISHISHSHVRTINREGNRHVIRIRGEANRHINKLRQIVNTHIRRLENKRRRHLTDIERQHRRHMQQREIQNRNHIANKQAVNTRHETFIARAAAHFSDIDYLNTYHGIKIINNRITYGGKAYVLKCSQTRWYTKWCNCYKKEHSVTTCLDNLSNGGLIAPYGGAVAVAAPGDELEEDSEPEEAIMEEDKK